jgi:Na+-transporting methylmalonyl-CoA/oxaloacetate decarboxylase gamma subunit
MPEIDWVEVGQIAGYGYLTVFVVLGILAAIIWVLGKLLPRIESRKKE